MNAIVTAPADTLRVQRLRLPAQAAPSLLPRVEDALRTASRPPGSAQHWVLVKHLRLKAERGASAQSLSRQMGLAWQQVWAQARPLAQASDSDEVVWAPDAASARRALLQRWLADEPCNAWYWAAVARSAGLGHAQPPPGLAALDAVDAAQAAAIVALLIGPQIARGGAAGDTGFSADDAVDWHAAAPLFAAPARWALAAAVVAALPQRLQAAAERAWRPSLPAAAATSASHAPPARRTDAPATPAQAASARLAATAPSQDAAPWWNMAQHPPIHTATPPASEPAATEVRTAWQGQASDWAGLWLMLPLLRLSGLDQGEQPRALALALMHRAAARWTLDPLCRDWLAAHTPQAHTLSPCEIDNAWRELRCHLLRHTRLPLRRLLHRPGQVWLSPHRVDVLFALRSADIRIRRAGLDIDPGHLPWLDSVIHFHYR